MNKQIIALFAAAGLTCFAGLASAAATAVTGPSNQVTPTECALLSENITVGMSARVTGAYNCSEVLNVIKVGSCHEGGSRGLLACNSVQNQDAIDAATAAGTTPPAPTYPAGCAADGTGTSTVLSYKGFTSTSQGGAMSEQALGGKCTDASLTGLRALR
jgi:hypothetical protein